MIIKLICSKRNFKYVMLELEKDLSIHKLHEWFCLYAAWSTTLARTNMINQDTT